METIQPRPTLPQTQGISRRLLDLQGVGHGALPVRFSNDARNGDSQARFWPALLRFSPFRWPYMLCHTLDPFAPSLQIQHLEKRPQTGGIHARADGVPRRPQSIMRCGLFKRITTARGRFKCDLHYVFCSDSGVAIPRGQLIRLIRSGQSSSDSPGREPIRACSFHRRSSTRYLL